MTQHPETSDKLLLRIRDSADRHAWGEFARIYHPAIQRVARGIGLQDADAADVAQEVMWKIERAIGSWDAGQPSGSFRRWLRTIARNTAMDAFRRVKPDAGCGGTTAQVILQAVPSRESVEARLKIEIEREAFQLAAARVRNEFNESTWQAFWLTMVDGQSCDETALSLGKSVGAIYTARSRVVRRLKAEVEHFDWLAMAEMKESE